MISAPDISAIVLAAGQSRRMGVPKMILPWGNTTVIGRVVTVLRSAGVGDIVVVTGGAQRQVELALEGLPVRKVYNPRFGKDEMAFSLQVGLSLLDEEVEGALVTLGDQPQVEESVVRAVLSAFKQTRAELVVPSFQTRRGHPWIIARPLWPAVLGLQPGKTLRDVMNEHASLIHYLPVNSDSILKDVDTPEDYRRERPGSV